MKRSLIVIAMAAALAVWAQTGPQLKSRQSDLAAQMQRTLAYLQQNGARPRPDQRPTTLTEDEINAWLNSPYARLPKGVQMVHLTGSGGGAIDGTARVDFDQITAGQRSSNPLLSLFTGVHNVEATAHADGSGGQARLHIETVSLDGMGIPRMALEFFVDHYLKPKYPEAGLDSTWPLPAKVDTVQVQTHRMVLTQK